ncbi:unnamed protein product [Tenebrio molitor]|nr:unnamed protein product [Tenebrio molitor]
MTRSSTMGDPTRHLPRFYQDKKLQDTSSASVPDNTSRGLTKSSARSTSCKRTVSTKNFPTR